jgi:hypothetical protein
MFFKIIAKGKDTKVVICEEISLRQETQLNHVAQKGFLFSNISSMDEFGLMREPEIFVRQSVFKDFSLHHLIGVLSIPSIERFTLNVFCDLFIDLIGNCRDRASCHFRK